MNNIDPTEIRIVRKLVEAAQTHGYLPHLVDDFGDLVKVRNLREVLDAVFAVEGAWLVLRHPETDRRLSFLLIVGNGADILSDHTDHPDAERIFEAAIAGEIY